MKKFLSFALALSLAVAFTACGGGSKTTAPVEAETAKVCVPAPGEICPVAS